MYMSFCCYRFLGSENGKVLCVSQHEMCHFLPHYSTPKCIRRLCSAGPSGEALYQTFYLH